MRHVNKTINNAKRRAIALILFAAIMLSLPGEMFFVNAASTPGERDANTGHASNYLSFASIERIKAEGKLNVLEIIPDNATRDTLGFYIEGAENLLTTADLTALGQGANASTRNSTLNSIVSRYGSLISSASDNSAPIYYKGYNEIYPWQYNDDTEDYQQITLANQELTNLTVADGIAFKEEQNGDFLMNGDYVINVDDGRFAQQITNVVFGDHPTPGENVYYYSPVFTPVTSLMNPSGGSVTSEQALNYANAAENQGINIYHINDDDPANPIYVYQSNLGDGYSFDVTSNAADEDISTRFADVYVITDYGIPSETRNNNYYAIHEAYVGSSGTLINASGLYFDLTSLTYTHKSAFADPATVGNYTAVTADADNIAQACTVIYKEYYFDAFENNDWFYKYSLDGNATGVVTDIQLTVKTSAEIAADAAFDHSAYDLIAVTEGYNTATPLTGTDLTAKLGDATTGNVPVLINNDMKTLVYPGLTDATENAIIYSDTIISVGFTTTPLTDTNMDSVYRGRIDDEIDRENALRQLTSVTTIPIEISIASAIRYLLNTSDARIDYQKEEINVLQLQPIVTPGVSGTDFIEGTDVLGWLGDTEDTTFAKYATDTVNIETYITDGRITSSDEVEGVIYTNNIINGIKTASNVNPMFYTAVANITYADGTTEQLNTVAFYANTASSATQFFLDHSSEYNATSYLNVNYPVTTDPNYANKAAIDRRLDMFNTAHVGWKNDTTSDKSMTLTLDLTDDYFSSKSITSVDFDWYTKSLPYATNFRDNGRSWINMVNASNTVNTVQTKGEKYTVNVTTMAVTEYIGKIDNINEQYDMIYIGGSTYGFNTQVVDGVTITNYNDNNMDGMVYTNIGDLYTDNRMTGYFSGLIDSDYYPDNHATFKPNSEGYNILNVTASNSSVRIGGFDLTQHKRDELIAFAATGSPIIIDDKLVEVGDEDGAKGDVGGVAADDTDSIDERYVDNCSYMFETLNTIYDDAEYPNVFSIADTTVPEQKLLIETYANLSKPKLVLSAMPTEYVGPTAANGLSSDDLLPNDELTYTFTIDNPTDPTPVDTKYTASLYLELNGDGKYDPTSEILDNLTITSNGVAVNNGELISGVEYNVTRRLPESIQGAVSWKLEVVKVGSESVTASQTGLTLNKPGEIIDIKILQVNYSDLSTRYDTYFNELRTAGLYNITVDKKLISEVNTLSGTDTDTNGINDLVDLLGNYNMLLIGFQEGYGMVDGGYYRGFNYDTTMAVNDFIDSGKATLFAHDTTFVANMHPEYLTTGNLSSKNGTSLNGSKLSHGWHVGYYMNTLMRDNLGMDKYGVTSVDYGVSQYHPNYVEFKADSGINTTDNPSYAASAYAGASDATLSQMENDGYAIAYVPGSDKTKFIDDTHGLTTYAAYRFTPTSGNALSPTDLSINQYGTTSSGVKDRSETTKISQVNAGQITSYPYNVNLEGFGGSQSTLTVGGTHDQYFQANVNNDELVVWYSLASDPAKSVYHETAFTNHYNDVANAYFIYNMGNVTYTGSGDGGTSTTPTPSYSEAMLFVNTMIAAYRATATRPTITLSNEVGGESITDLYITSALELNDADKIGGIDLSRVSDEEKRIYFYIENDTLGENQFISVSLRYDLNATNAFDDGDGFIQAIRAEQTEDAVGANALQNNTLYYFEITQELLDALSASNDDLSLLTRAEIVTIFDGEEITVPSEELKIHALGFLPLI